MRILLVESDPQRRAALRGIIRERGDALRQVHSGGQAQLVLGEDKSFDLLLVGMRSPMNAEDEELLDALASERLHDLPVLFLVDRAGPGFLAWLKQRPRSGMLSWKDYSECSPAIDRLVSDQPIEAGTDIRESFAGRDLRLLLVDDSPTVRLGFQRLLDKYGFIVETAGSAQEGLKKALTQPFDMAIVDYFMPAANGSELVYQLKSRQQTRNIVSLVITGTYSDEVITECLQAGAVDCLFKSEARGLLLARLHSHARNVRRRMVIEQEQRRLEAILASVGDGVYGVDLHGRIEFMNPTARDLLGLKADQTVNGESAHALFHHSFEDGNANPAASCFLSQAYQAGNHIESWQTVFWHANGDALPVECTAQAMEIDGSRVGTVVAFRDVSARRALEEELRWQASHDSLTKLYNRSFFEDQLAQECYRVRRSDQSSALLFLDVDRFKYVNDTACHAAGDKLLVEIAHRLRGRLRGGDILARLGGDEYAIILRNIAADVIFDTAEEFRRIVARVPFHYGGKNYRVSVTIGAVPILPESNSADATMANADIACHVAKNKGRNLTYVLADDGAEKASMDVELSWSARLQKAIAEERFELHYQPILAMRDIDFSRVSAGEGELWRRFGPAIDGRQATFEVLLRLPNEDASGFAKPAAFLTTAERFNLMEEIDHWVIQTAISNLGAELERGRDLRFSINLSADSLKSQQTVDLIKQSLHANHVAPDRLTFEISESRAVSNLDATRVMIDALRALGCKFALDDFGAGFSSFAHLKELNVNHLKIDGSFTQGLARDPIDMAVISAINDIAHSMGKRTVAEFVDDAQLLRYLRGCGVDYVQGYFVGKPTPVIESAFDRRRSNVTLLSSKSVG